MGGHVNTIWTDEQSAVLIEMLADGRSYAEIAAALNEQFNTTYSRNAACGKGFRLRVTAPPKIKARTPRKQRKRLLRTIKSLPRTEKINLRCTEIEPRNLEFSQLEPRDCRYPTGDGPFLFCGLPQQDGSSYCDAHEVLCHGAGPKITQEERHRRRWLWLKQTSPRGWVGKKSISLSEAAE